MRGMSLDLTTLGVYARTYLAFKWGSELLFLSTNYSSPQNVTFRCRYRPAKTTFIDTAGTPWQNQETKRDQVHSLQKPQSRALNYATFQRKIIIKQCPYEFGLNKKRKFKYHIGIVLGVFALRTEKRVWRKSICKEMHP